MRKNISQDVGAIHTSKKGNFQFRNFTFAIFLAEHCIIGIFCLEDNADVKGSKSSLNDKHTKTKDMGRESVVTANRYEVCYVCSCLFMFIVLPSCLVLSIIALKVFLIIFAFIY